jgi:putative membrane protein
MPEANNHSDVQPSSAIAPKRPSLTTEHLANERTYLAWIRTSLALTGFGFAVAKFGTWLRELSGQSIGAAEAARSGRSTTTGVIMIIAGGALAVLATWRHRAVGRQIETGTVKPAGATMLIVTAIVVMITIAVLYLVLNGSHR